SSTSVVADSTGVIVTGSRYERRLASESVSTVVIRAQDITSVGASSNHAINPTTLEEESVPAAAAGVSADQNGESAERRNYRLARVQSYTINGNRDGYMPMEGEDKEKRLDDGKP